MRFNPFTGAIDYTGSASSNLSGSNNPNSGAGFPASTGSLFVNTSNSTIWFKSGPLDTDWTQIVSSGGYFIDRFELTETDITNKYVVLGAVPADADKTQLTVIGGILQDYGTDFEVTSDDGGKRLSWNGLTLDSVLTAGDKLVITHN